MKPRPGEPKVALCNVYATSVNSDIDGTNTPHKFQIQYLNMKTLLMVAQNEQL